MKLTVNRRRILVGVRKLRRLGLILKASGEDWIEGFSLIKFTKKERCVTAVGVENRRGCNNPGERGWG